MVLTSAPLLASDVVALLASTLAAWLLTYASGSAGVSNFLPLFLALTAGLVAVQAALGLYPGTGLSAILELRLTIIAVAVLFLSLMLGDLIRGGEAGQLRLVLALTGLASVVALPVCRSLGRMVASRSRWWSEPILVLGNGDAAQRTTEYFASNPRLGLRPVAVPVDDDLAISHNPGDVAQLSGALRSVTLMAERQNAYWAAIPLPESPTPRLRHLAVGCTHIFPHLLLIHGTPDFPSLWSGASDCGGMLGIRIGKGLLLPGPRAVKRVMDTTFAILVGVAALPLFAVITVAIRMTSPGPVFYSQDRVGKGRRVFRMWKFTTMKPDADRLLQQYLDADPDLRTEWERDQKLRRDPRVTKIGALLRRTSLDELPQLWNVLRGEMSLVGPRPVPPLEIPRYGKHFGLYLNVTPGMTGLWQVSGRNRLPFEERVRLCSYYVQNWSPWLDVYILALTAKVVLRGDGAY